MYLEGMNISSISGILGVELGTVFSWIKKAKWALKVYKGRVKRESRKEVSEISINEMRTYIKRKS